VIEQAKSFVPPPANLYVAVDVDGTITRSNISFAFGRFLYDNGEISFFRALQLAAYYGAHCLGLLSIDRLHTLVFHALFQGRHAASIQTRVQQFFSQYGEALIRTHIREELFRRQAEGATIALLSSSPDFLVREVARLLSVDRWYGTEYVVDSQGRFAFLGRVVSGAVKAQIAREAKALRHCFVMAMTDSVLDKALLDEAHIVVVVVPDRQLARIAHHNGWRVINEA
jgi:HAD superfamily phosphoserine phosphatase-like hydrolase